MSERFGESRRKRIEDHAVQLITIARRSVDTPHNRALEQVGHDILWVLEQEKVRR